jgi:tetratricopeptide (TPR) repeat protein
LEQEKSFPPHREPIRDARLLPIHAPAQIIGRNHELAALNAHLKQGGCALLTGADGLGKTALAAVLATAYSRTQPGGVLWLDVVEDDAAYLMARLGRAYGIDTYPMGALGREQAADRLRAVLTAEKPLIVLDGRLYLAAVAEVLATCAPNVPTLLTNAKRGNGTWQTFVLERLSPNDSQAVIRLYAGINDPNAYRADLEALCQRLDGAPLTLELLGRLAAVDRLTPAELRKELEYTTSRESQQAVLTLTFKRLSAPLQGLLLVLATTFTGSATVTFLSAASHVPPQQVVSLMRALVARGLVREATAYGQPIFSVHEIVQRYALNYLRNNKRLEPLEQRALSAALSYATAVSERTYLAVELDNLLGAAAYATAQGDSRAVATLRQALAPLAAYGFRPELDMLDQLAARLHSTTDALGETQAAERVSADTQPDGATTQPNLEEPIADTAATPVVQPIQTSAQVSATSAQSAPPTLPEAPPTDPALPVAAHAEPILIDEDDSEQSDTLPLTPSQRAAPATAESVRGRALLAEAETLADPDAKRERLSRATELLRADEDWLGTAQALEQLGTLCLAQNKPGEAILMFEQAAVIFHRYDQLAAERSVLAQIGRAYAAQNQPQRAAEYYTRALFLAHEGHDQDAEIEALIRLAETHYLLRDYAAAERNYRKALHLAYQRADAALQAHLTLALGALLLDDIRTLSQAAQLLEEAAALAPERAEPKRLLKRATERIRRWQRANLPLAPARDNREFAADAYE